MKMRKSTVWALGWSTAAAIVLIPPLAARADSTVIVDKPGKHVEKSIDDDGTKSTYQSSDNDSKREYKNNRGVSYKERQDGHLLKRSYKDPSCKQDTVQNMKTGQTNVTSRGDCPP